MIDKKEKNKGNRSNQNRNLKWRNDVEIDFSVVLIETFILENFPFCPNGFLNNNDNRNFSSGISILIRIFKNLKDFVALVVMDDNGGDGDAGGAFPIQTVWHLGKIKFVSKWEQSTFRFFCLKVLI